MLPLRPAIIFDGGGFTGANGAGSLCALEDFGIPPAAYFQGVSVGAINAAKMTEMGGKNASVLKKMWLDMEAQGPEAIFPRRKIVPHLASPSLFPRTGVEDLVAGLNCEAVWRSSIHLDIICVHEPTERKKVFTNHDPLLEHDPELLKQMIYASTALPGIFAPVALNGGVYSDGLYISIERAFRFDCDCIFVLLNSPRPRLGENGSIGNEMWLRRLLKTLHTSIEMNTIEELRKGRLKQKLLHRKCMRSPLVIPLRALRSPKTIGTTGFRKAGKNRRGDIDLLMEFAYEDTTRRLNEIFRREI